MTATEARKTEAPYRHDWDVSSHVIWEGVPVAEVELADVLAGGTLQVEGKARAEHRGKEALRFDLLNLDSGGIGRLVLTTDNRISDVKRYDDGDGSTRVDASSPILAAARAWAVAREDDRYEDDEQVLFAYICAAVTAYGRIGTDVSVTDDEREAVHTLDAIAENLCEGYHLTRD